MITKEMLKRCLNEKMQAWCALDEDVRKAIEENQQHQQFLCNDGEWMKDLSPSRHRRDMVFRLSPDTPTEKEYDEREVSDSFANSPYAIGLFGCFVPCSENWHTLSNCVCHNQFIGIIYRDSSGKETLRTSVDAAFGTPVRVRFRK